MGTLSLPPNARKNVSNARKHVLQRKNYVLGTDNVGGQNNFFRELSVLYSHIFAVLELNQMADRIPTKCHSQGVRTFEGGGIGLV